MRQVREKNRNSNKTRKEKIGGTDTAEKETKKANRSENVVDTMNVLNDKYMLNILLKEIDTNNNNHTSNVI